MKPQSAKSVGYVVFDEIKLSPDGKRYKSGKDSQGVQRRFYERVCSVDGLNVVTHHIIPWAVSVELRMKLENGLTVCESCHKLIHNYMEAIHANQTTVGQK